MPDIIATLWYPSHAAVVRYPGSNLGRWYILCAPFLAVIVVLRGESLSYAGFNYTGFMWAAAVGFGGLLLFLEIGLRPKNGTAFPLIPWFVWLMLPFASLLWVSEAGIHQLRDWLHLATPVMMGVVASYSIRTREHLAQLIRAFYFAMPLLWIPVGLWAFFGLREENGVAMFVEVRWIGVTAVAVGSLFITETKRHFFRGWCGWAMCLTITFATAGRMASAVMLLMPIFNPVARNSIRKLVVSLVMVIAGLALLSTPIFQERFFTGGTGGVDDIVKGDFDDTGRFYVWELVYEEALKKPWLGHGVGSSEVLLEELDTKLKLPHNDYLRIGYELGITGIVVTLSILLWQLWSLGRMVRRTDGVVQQAFGAAWLGLALFLPIAFTGNPLSYTLSYMDPVFVLMGAAYAVSREETLHRLSGQTLRMAGRESSSPTPAELSNFRHRNSS